ncbi:class I SAM-dependent methyltransferase [Sporosarcina siberiensis]|uniref:Class I SAM-dependent methyltransferase n=1 Tax=Sporosarcina siberiensis TaxID=1365606 RepID=A0ABW4SB41_9BACL
MKSTKDSWNADLYDAKHSFVSNYGNDIIELLTPKEDEKILDLGCGTGDLANRISVEGANVVGVDQSKNMVGQALSKYPEIQFTVGDATSLDYKDEFDAVFSNATLHWIKQPEKALGSIYKSLKTNGRFVAEFGGKSNVQMITDEIILQFTEAGLEFKPENFPWYFPSIGEYATLMEKAGFRVTFAQHFDRLTPLDGENGMKNWIEMFGSQIFEGLTKELIDSIVSRVETNLKNTLYKDGIWLADYKRIRVIGLKE